MRFQGQRSVRHQDMRRFRQATALLAAISLSVSVAACSDSDEGKRESMPSWIVINTSPDNDVQSLVYEQTGIQYISILKSQSGERRYGLCERYGPDGHIMRDGDATKGGPFEMTEISSDDDSTIYRDSQTGIAYIWHSWQSENAYAGQGLVVCRDSNGSVLRWDDDEFFPVVPSEENGGTPSDRSPEADGKTKAVANEGSSAS